MIDRRMPVMVVMDIDGTQIREDIAEKDFTAQDLAEIKQLKDRLDTLSREGVIVVHATNRMAELYAKDHGRLLSVPDYVSCSASTEVLKINRDTGMAEPDTAYAAKVAASGFDADRCRAQAGQYASALSMTGPEHQTDRKVSFVFDPATPLDKRDEIHAALQSMQPAGTSVFMVEDPETHIIDFLPEVCTKLSGILHIAEMEAVPLGNIIVMGNSNNDIPMCEQSFNCVAVGNARVSLKEHIAALQDRTQDTSRYVIAPESNARGVLWGLRHFDL